MRYGKNCTVAFFLKVAVQFCGFNKFRSDLQGEAFSERFKKGGNVKRNITEYGNDREHGLSLLCFCFALLLYKKHAKKSILSLHIQHKTEKMFLFVSFYFSFSGALKV